MTPEGGCDRAAAFHSLRPVLLKAGFVLAAIAATAATCGRSPTAPTSAGTSSSTTSSTSAPPAQPTTYYVSPAGNDGNPGTQAQPFGTIQRAADVVNPGETIIVQDGTYSGTGAGTACSSGTSRPVVCLTRGGTSSQWVTIRAEHPLGAKIDGRSNTSTYGFDFLAGANYIRVDGFEVFGLGNGNGDASGVVIFQGGHDVTISHNEIHDIGRLCTDTTNGQTAIFIANARVTVDSNRIHDIGRFQPGEGGCSPATSYYTNHDHGLYINGNSGTGSPGASDVTVMNNVIWNIGRGWPVQIYPGSVSNISILNNTFAGTNVFSKGQIIVAASTNNLRIENNVFDQPLDAGINFYSGNHASMTVANNLSSASLATSVTGNVAFAANMEGVDPQLNPSLQPGAGSPVVDRGMSLSEVPVDINGTRRPQGAGWDIGAYEFVKAALTAPARLLLFSPPGATAPKDNWPGTR